MSRRPWHSGSPACNWLVAVCVGVYQLKPGSPARCVSRGGGLWLTSCSNALQSAACCLFPLRFCQTSFPYFCFSHLTFLTLVLFSPDCVFVSQSVRLSVSLWFHLSQVSLWRFSFWSRGHTCRLGIGGGVSGGQEKKERKILFLENLIWNSPFLFSLNCWAFWLPFVLNVSQ